MKKKRYLPFGYQMNEGNIIPDILESSAVQSIFENYRNGASLQTLAKQMQQSGLKYRENAVWNKAMIARILDCEKYISEEFPAILPFGGSKKGIRFSKKFFETHRKPHGYWVPVISVTKDKPVRFSYGFIFIYNLPLACLERQGGIVKNQFSRYFRKSSKTAL